MGTETEEWYCWNPYVVYKKKNKYIFNCQGMTLRSYALGGTVISDGTYIVRENRGYRDATASKNYISVTEIEEEEIVACLNKCCCMMCS